MNSIFVTRPYLRNQVRYKLGRGVASDMVPPGPVGDPSVSQKKPSNEQINAQINESLAELNLMSGISMPAQPIAYAVPAQTANGPVSIDLTGYPGGINSVMSAWWSDSSGNITPLTYTSSYDLGRDYTIYAAINPGTPLQLFVEGYKAWLQPGNDAAGTLFIRANVGLLAPQNDQDPIGQMSTDETAGLAIIVAAELAATEVDDQVMRSRLQYLTPKAQMWKSAIAKSVGKRNQSYIPGVTLRSTRVWSGFRSR